MFSLALRRIAPPIALGALLFGAFGCASVEGHAVATGPLRLPPYSGKVALYTPGRAVAGRDLGIVEVHASGDQGTIDALLPVFVQKAASLGANAAAIERVGAAFSIVEQPYMPMYAYSCGYAACAGARLPPPRHEAMTVFIVGRAIRVDEPEQKSAP